MRRGAESGAARTCSRRAADFGGCRCQAYALTGDAARTDPACALSPDHGVIRSLTTGTGHPAGADAPAPTGARPRPTQGGSRSAQGSGRSTQGGSRSAQGSGRSTQGSGRSAQGGGAAPRG
ncbi:hypothetical protein GCM10009577_11290 [Streptomyces javensis]